MPDRNFERDNEKSWTASIFVGIMHICVTVRTRNPSKRRTVTYAFKSNQLLVGAYVDDLIVTLASEKIIENLKKELI